LSPKILFIRVELDHEMI